MSPPVDLLRRIACGADTPADREVLAERVRAYLDAAPEGGSLDEAFGLTTAAGRLPWWRVQALATRDAALRTMAERFHADRPVARQAAEIHASLRNYAATSWRFDRGLSAPPPRYVGTWREMAFDALRACDAVPSAERIRRVLSSR